MTSLLSAVPSQLALDFSSTTSSRRTCPDRRDRARAKQIHRAHTAGAQRCSPAARARSTMLPGDSSERQAFQPFHLADDRDGLLGGGSAPRWRSRLGRHTPALALVAVLAAVAIALSALAIKSRQQAPQQAPAAAPPPTWQGVQRIAFGRCGGAPAGRRRPRAWARPADRALARLPRSCSSYDLRPQPIWDAVVAAQPDGWLWLGDLAYLDTALVDCAQVPGHPQCNCSQGVTTPPFFTSCLPLDLAYAQFRFQAQVRAQHGARPRRPPAPARARNPACPGPACLQPPLNPAAPALQVNLPSYQRLLQYLCPGHQPGAAPPQGSDPAACPKFLLGVYDDHDFGANNADGRCRPRPSSRSPARCPPAPLGRRAAHRPPAPLAWLHRPPAPLARLHHPPAPPRLLAGTPPSWPSSSCTWTRSGSRGAAPGAAPSRASRRPTRSTRRAAGTALCCQLPARQPPAASASACVPLRAPVDPHLHTPHTTAGQPRPGDPGAAAGRAVGALHAFAWPSRAVAGPRAARQCSAVQRPSSGLAGRARTR